ncbi:MAG: 50S ribosomal protein L29 [Chloroflexota bacterium]
MPSAKAQELRNLSVAELRQRLEEARRELFNLRLQLAMRQLENYKRIKEVRHDIARMLTILTEKQRQGEA